MANPLTDLLSENRLRKRKFNMHGDKRTYVSYLKMDAEYQEQTKGLFPIIYCL